MADLIIIESPNKIKKVAKYSGAEVLATAGHFKDLPAKELGVDVKDNYKPKFVYMKAKGKDGKKIANTIKSKAKGRRVIIATDPDREGYAIGTMVYWEVKNVAKEVLRAEIHEITEKGVKEALKKAVPFEKTNKGLFNAFLGRRVGDRIIGYTLSPIATKQLKTNGQDKAYSVGRVQSPALRLVVEREREIRNFKPTPYWEIEVILSKDGKKFKAHYQKGKIEDKEEAEKIYSQVDKSKTATVEKVEKKKTKQSPKAPFTTSELQIVANSQLRFAPEKTMQLAQDLFENGLITYHRTDSVRLSDEYIQQLRDFIPKEFGKEYLPDKPKQYKSKNSQADAHEGIRPTDVYPISKIKGLIKENGLTQDHEKLLTLIYKRTIASQMADAIFDTTTAIFDIAGHKFKTTGRVLRFDGFLKLYKEVNNNENEKDKEKDNNQTLPPLEKGENVNKEKANLLNRMTKPPNRYTEGSLVKMLEKLGIGRPSTYATAVQILKLRNYVKVQKGKLVPTERGERLIDFLDHNHNWIIDYELSRRMEEFLDGVEDGKESWVGFVRNLHAKLNFYVPELDTKPSEKQVEFAKQLAEKIGESVPEDILQDRNKLSEYIEKAKEKLKDINPPSEKQVELAKSLAEKTGLEISDDVLSSRSKIESFINKAMKEVKKQAENKPLTEKQVEIVNKYAPDEIKATLEKGKYKEVRKWLDGFFNKGSKGKGRKGRKGKKK